MVTQLNPVLTLRYGGVEFSLIPSGSGQAIFEQLASVVHGGTPSGGGGRGGGTTTTTGGEHHDDQQQQPPAAGVLWRLVNFTGTLRVVASARTSETPADAPDGAAASASAAVPGRTASSLASSVSPHRRGESTGTHAGKKARVPVVSSTKGQRRAAVGGGGGGDGLPQGTKKGAASALASTIMPKKQRQTSIVAFAMGAGKGSKRLAPASATATAAARSGDGMDSNDDESGEQPTAKKSRRASSTGTKPSEEGPKEEAKLSSRPGVGGATGVGKENESASKEEGGEEQEEEEENSQLTLLGQDEGSFPPLSQETATTSSASNPATARDLLMAGALAATDEDLAASDSITSNTMGTIQHIMDTAQSQATETGIWTDEGDESDRSFPTQDDEEMNEEHLETARRWPTDGCEAPKEESRVPTETPPSEALAPESGSTGSTVEDESAVGVPTVSETDVPRVSLGDTPVKGRTSADAGEPLDDPTTVAPPETQDATPPPPPLAPCPRWGHTLTSIGNHKLVLYGGQTLVAASADGGAALVPTTLNDVMVYDSAEQTWFQPYNCQGTSHGKSRVSRVYRCSSRDVTSTNVTPS
jgi:Galactose oxidase, central domain